jgi:predicted DNA-binding transcriptional regulator YafY
MSYKFDSLITILNKIDRKEQVTVKSLMNDLEMSERTVYRYIQTLEVAGFPIVFDRVKDTYTFSETFSLSKPNLTVDETLALALSKNLMKTFGEGMEKSLAKIEEKLSLKKTNTPKSLYLTADPQPPIIQDYLPTIHEAILNFKRIHITYNAPYQDGKSERKIDPYYLFFQEGFWHIRCYCHLREELRTFALDRIAELKVLNEHFMPQNIAPEEELSASFGKWLDGEPTEVVLIFDKEAIPHVNRKVWHQTQKTKTLKDGRIEMRLTVKGTGGIKKWIYQWMPFVEIVAPKGFRKEILQELKCAIIKHDKT